MNNLNQQSNSQKCCEGNCCSLVEGVIEFNTSYRFEALELFESSAGNSGSSARTRSRALASADRSAISQAHSSDLVGMNGSAVISTGSLSGEGMNLLATALVDDVHGESSIDIVDFMPSDRDGLQRINNDHSFIKEDDLGMNENQVEDRTQNQAPRNTGESTAETVIQDVDVTECADRKEGAEGHDITTTWSEGFGVSHVAILSRNERRAA